MKLSAVPESGECLNVMPHGSPFSISLGYLFHLPRRRKKANEKNKQLHFEALFHYPKEYLIYFVFVFLVRLFSGSILIDKRRI